MTTTDILAQLKDQLAHLDTTLATLTKERDRIAGAVAALNGDPTPQPGPSPSLLPKPTPVVELVMETVRGAATGTTFDHKSLVHRVQANFPTQAARIKTGVYTAVATLLKRKQLKLAPGGFQLHPEAQP